MGRRKPLTRDEVESSYLFHALLDKLEAETDELSPEVICTSKDKRRRFTGTMRATIYSRDKGLCFYCGVFIPSNTRYHADHVVPHSRNGRTTCSNGVTSCVRCNLKKSNRFKEGEFKR